MEESGNWETFFPFFILILIGLVKFIKKRGAKKEQEVRRGAPYVPPPKPCPRPTPKVIFSPPTPVKPLPPPEVKRKRVPRIVKLVRSRREIVLLSEILKKDCS